MCLSYPGPDTSPESSENHWGHPPQLGQPSQTPATCGSPERQAGHSTRQVWMSREGWWGGGGAPRPWGATLPPGLALSSPAQWPLRFHLWASSREGLRLICPSLVHLCPCPRLPFPVSSWV